MANKLPLKGDHVGSFLRTESIKQARAAYAKGEIDKASLKEVEDREIEKLVQKQIEAGLKTITDGEFRRIIWHHDFFSGFEGIELIKNERKATFGGGNKPKPITIVVTDKIKNNHHYMIEHFKFLKKVVDKYGDGTQVTKFAIPAPSVIMYRSINEREKEIYSNAVDMFHDLSVAYREVVTALYDAGCRYIQFDDTTFTAFNDPTFTKRMMDSTGLSKDEILDLIIKTTNDALQDKPEDLTTTVHMCRGNFRSNHLHTDGDYAYVTPIFDQLHYDGFFLEYDDERSGGFEPLKHIKRRDVEIVLGLITSKFPELEDPLIIKEKIAEASQFIPLENLAISPQCGFASSEEGNVLTEEEQWNKIKHMIQIAESVWGKVYANK
ncbi:5-methyltetrahydropteroyltriglutamate--homocysteine S-methyltransferase [Bacillus sp. SD088]|uniref:5-methyltetrahydropteroyltriglutamate-- homocysteine S-methyltransferase n=1 Tax=Bacillus sp. SD088 TaxID=2782012 RepID=UPI001A9772D6|nr:5-methyltetrahydropteroyltriglutamate--homocysteine S-methyltransferase [Bacillus sp. SD088]MBO0992809.1 5-methyltetrahydropteroyltriglutamate--homocysteine S-methyltransferase [Bacillus sp. SD088]